MGQVILNGRILACEDETVISVNGNQIHRQPVTLGGRKVTGVNINGYDYPPAPSDCVLYLPGLPGQGSTIWDRSPSGNHATIVGATWKQLPSGPWYLSHDGNDYIKATAHDLTTFSASVWAFLPDVTNQQTFVGEFSGAGSWALYALNGGFRFTINGVANYNSVWNSLATNTWFHVAFSVVSNGTLDVYHNGINVFSTAVGALNTANYSAFISYGSRDGAGGEPVHVGSGLALDRFFNAVIPASEPLPLYNQERHLFGR